MSLTHQTRFDTFQPRPTTVICIMSLVEHPKDEPSLDEIMQAVSAVFHMKRPTIRSPRRDIAAIRARATFYMAAQDLTSRSLGHIAAAVNRTHSAVCHVNRLVKTGQIDIAAQHSAVLAALGRGGE